MMLRAISTIIVLVATLGAALPAASEAERDEHFATVVDLIGNDLYYVAKRQFEDFASRGYSDPGGYYRMGLEWYLADTFSLDHPEAGDPQALAKPLSQAGKNLPVPVQEIFVQSGKVQRIALKIQRDFVKPDSPPPVVPLADAEVEKLKHLIKSLIDATDATMKEKLAEIEAFQGEVDKVMQEFKEDAHFWEVMKKATFQRFEFTEALYQAYKPLREILLRGDAYGLDQAFIGQIDDWLYNKMRGGAKVLMDWDWLYGDYYVYLRHRSAVLLAEAMRHNKEGNARKISGVSYDETSNMFFQCLDLDTSRIDDPKAAADVERLKYQIWSDLLYWHLLMGDDQSLRKGRELWAMFLERAEEDRAFGLASRDRYRNVMAGHLYMLAARLHHAAGDTSNANALMAEVQSGDNFFSGNAKLWITYWVSGGAGSTTGDPWVKQPTAMEPARALTVARALISQARKQTSVEDQRKAYVQAAATLRDGVLGLPASSYDETFVEQAPALYQTLAYTMYKRGWKDRAAVVALEGLSRFLPDQWGEKPTRDNPWFRRGQLTEAGAMVRRLANDALAYAQSMVSLTRSAGAKDALSQAIDYLKAYDPEKVEDNLERMELIIMLQQAENEADYRLALEKALEYYRTVKDAADRTKNDQTKEGRDKHVDLQVEMAWALRMATRCQYFIWNLRVEQDLDPSQVDEANQELQKYAGILDKFCKWALSDGSGIPDDKRGEFSKGLKEVTNLRIAALYKSGKYRQVLEELGPGFWEELPDDPALVRQSLVYFARSVYGLNKEVGAAIQDGAREAARNQDAAQRLAALRAVFDQQVPRLLAQWPTYVRARSIFEQQMRRNPAMDVQHPDIRKQIALVFDVTSRLASFVGDNLAHMKDDTAGMARAWIEAAGGELPDPAFVQALDLDQDGQLADGELDAPGAAQTLIGALERQAKLAFADLFEPLISDDEKPNNILAIANTLWDLDQKERAARLYEIYKQSLRKDGGMRAFAQDPRGVVDSYQAKLLIQNRYKDFWGGRGSIPDLLIDEPGFMEQYVNPNVRLEDLDERKRNFSDALRRVKEFEAELEKRRSLLPDADRLFADLAEFKDLVQKLAYNIVIDRRLIEAYREAGRLKEAVELAHRLYDYDPLDRTAMVTVVDGTLEAARTDPGSVTEEDIRKAQEIAARLRNDAKNNLDWPNYWIAWIQILELASYKGDVPFIDEQLANFNRRNQHPAVDLFEPVPKDFELADLPDGYGVYRQKVPVAQGDGTAASEERYVGKFDRTDVQILQRFLRVYTDVQGVSQPPPLEITEELVIDPDDPTADITVQIVREKGVH